MAAEVQDVTGIHLLLFGVVLLRSQAELTAFRSELGADTAITQTVTQGIPGGTPETGGTITLPKERITLSLTRGVSRVFREYPASPSELKRLAEVAQLAIDKSDLSDQSPRAFGYMIELTFDQDSGQPAHRYLADRLFVPAFASVEDDWLLKGGEGALEYVNGNTRRLIDLEAQADDDYETRVLLRFSEHTAEHRVPDGDEMLSLLVAAWEKARDFVDRLDRRDNAN